MMLADTMAIFFSVVGLLIALPALWLTLSALWPALGARAQAACQDKLWKSFIIGLPVVAIVVVLVGIFSKLPEGVGGILSITAISTGLLMANFGLTALATLVGHRLPSPRDAARPWLVTLRGSILLEFSLAVPVVGWFLLFPIALVIGVGTFIRALYYGKNKSEIKLPPHTEAGRQEPALQEPA